MELAWSDGKQKFSKTPIDVNTGLPANSDDMGVSFLTATQHLGENRVLSYRHRDCSPRCLGQIDCDRCVALDGSISRRVQNLLRYMDTYATYSVTDGIQALCWLDEAPPDGHKDRQWDVEFYWQFQSIPITGNRVVLPDWESPDDLQPRTKRFLTLHKSRFADVWLPPAPSQPAVPSCVLSRDEILVKLFREPAGGTWADIYAGNWQGYYESPSDADLALLIKFAFYTGKDRHMMESMFSECPLASILIRGTVAKPKKWRKPKWSSAKYRQRTIGRAITKTTAMYTPRQKPMSDSDLYKMRRQQIQAERKQK